MSYFRCRRQAGRLPRAKSASISHSLQQNFLFIAHERREATVLRVLLGERGKSMGRINALARVAHAQLEEGEVIASIPLLARLLLRRYQNARKGVDPN